VPVPASGGDLDDFHALSAGFAELAARVNPSVVQVFVSRYEVSPALSATADGLIRRERASGSGVIVDPEGYVLTNAHVVSGADDVRVRLTGLDAKGGSSILPATGRLLEARIVGIDPETDLAVLAIRSDRPLQALEIADSDEVRQGQVVFAFGSPFALQNSVTMGIVSAVARQLEAEDPMIYIQTDATINPGNSGGPLVDTRGRLVGINTLIYSRSGGSEGLGFAAPANIVRAIYQQIRGTGRVRRGVIGVHAQTITPLLARGLGLPREHGVILADVSPGGPGDFAGLRAGDIVLALDGKPMENGRQLDVNVYRRAVGQSVTLELLRLGERLVIEVPVIEREEPSSRLAAMVSRDDHLLPRLGILALTLDDRLRELLPDLREPSGVVVARTSVEGPFGDARFRPGDVVHLVNGRRVTTVAELRAALDSLARGDALALQIERDGRFMYLAFEID
jgi:serine protease Do